MPRTSHRRFDERYREELHLRDGTLVVIRLIRPDDKKLLADGIAQMSPQSRFRRFFAYRDHLTERELVYLTEYDADHHVALGAATTDADGVQHGLGVARFVRLMPPDGPADGSTAEAAVAIVDDAQGKGLGRVLLDRLIAAARERGIHTFRFDVLAENDAMRGLVERAFPGTAEIATEPEPGVIGLDCPLPEPRPEDAGSEALIYRLLKLAATGTVRVLRGIQLAPHALGALGGMGAIGGRASDPLDAVEVSDDDGPAPTLE